MNYMKKINLLLLFGVLSIMTFGFSACSDDGDEIGNASELLGLWEPIHAEGYEIFDGERDAWDEDVNAASNDADYNRVEFLDGGIYNNYYYYNGWKKDVANGVYKLNGKKLVVRNDEEEETYELTIVSLTSTQLILETKESWGDEEFYEKVTYKKIN